MTCAQKAAAIVALIPPQIDPAWNAVPIILYEVPQTIGEKRPAFFGVGDPHKQISAEAPLAILMGDEAVNLRLKFIHAQLDASNDRVKVYLDRWNIRTVKQSECPSCFSKEEMESPNRFSAVLLHPLDENPELALHGIITAQMFDCLHGLVDPKTNTKKYEKAWRDTMAANLKSLHQRKHDDPELAFAIAELGPHEVERQIGEVAKLRHAWEAKVVFYQWNARKHPELEHGRLPPANGRNILKEIAEKPTDAADKLEFEQFLHFYSQNQSQQLDPTIIRRAWDLPRPPLWENNVISPITIPLPKPPAKP